jgi:hypothetical protein
MPRIGMSHPSHLIAITFIQNPDVEHPVVDNQKEHRPFYERPVKPLHSLLDKCGFVVQVFEGEKITSRDEEKRHVELENELT